MRDRTAPATGTAAVAARPDAAPGPTGARLAATVASTAALAAVLGATVAALADGAGVTGVRFSVLAMVGAALVVVDACTRRLPDLVTLPALAGVVAFDLAAGAATGLARDGAGGAWSGATAAGSAGLLGALVLGGAYFVLAWAGTMGGGDVKLAALIGASLVPACGWWSLVTATVAAYGLALPHAIVGVVRARRGVERAGHLPFGPYLVAGAVAAVLLHAAGLGGPA